MLIRSILFILLTGVTGWLCLGSPEISSGQASGVVLSLPRTAPGLVSESGEPDPVEIKLLPEDTEFAKAVYHTPTQDVSRLDLVNASIVLSGAERRSIHRPEVCLQGQGWTLLGSQILPVTLEGGKTLKVKDLYIEKAVALKSGEKKMLRAHYIYWFVGTDVTTPSHVERIWLTLWDNISRNINHRWAYPSFMAIVTENFKPEDIGQRIRSNEQTVKLLTDLIKDVAPQFQKEFMSLDRQIAVSSDNP
jgi:hypothetical protein